MHDPDWFFWVLPKLYGNLASEAQIWRERHGPSKFQNQIRASGGSNIVMNSVTGSVALVSLKPIARRILRWTTRRPYLDLTWPFRRKKYDKRAGQIIIQDFRRHYSGEHKRLTKARCEEFFNNARNFVFC